MVKDLKRSIRDKYKRRERDLYYVLEQYLIHADDRLDESRAGKIRDRERVEELVSKCRELLQEVPVPKEFEIDPNMTIEEFLGENDTEQILKEMKEWSDSLTEEEWEELRNHHDKSSPNK
ncbi:hypothetical protein J7J47_06955 [Halomonas sp. ISL-60]|uniref:hypothetical protein n=1 Tax=Halomonas sp. ISL-56 TaxID=2819149 RepID=UPI001BE81945|nr:hypothetical protein [Halomonas sp. ISL-56]MBT2771975.1 hypothetical protein [Halomonas sp. ISL-60]MBT2802943.1 hypothetical protein [Halomonas sp. ISL-56]